MLANLAKCSNIQEPCAASYAWKNTVWAPVPPWDPTRVGQWPPPHRHPTTSTSSSWAHSGWGRRVNCEWGRPTTRANKSTEPLFSRVQAQQWTAGGSHEYLIDGVREAGGGRWGGVGWEDEVGVEDKCRNIKRMVADRKKVWTKLGEKILRHYIRDLKGVREGE